MTITAPARPPLVVVPSVAILAVGENWHLSTGDTTFTPADLASAVAAQDDPSVRAPILKLGHTDERPGFDGQPAFGKLINLRTEDEGMTLVADVAGVPAWLADIWPTAYPSRSIEGYWDMTTATGHVHPFAITALALLGEVAPGIETLADLPLAFGIEANVGSLAGLAPTTPAFGMVAAETSSTADTARRFAGPRVAASIPLPPPAPAVTAASPPPRTAAIASVSYEDVRRAWYDQLSPAMQWGWWIRELVIDPPELIVDDDEGALHRVTYSITGTTVTFGEPTPVRVEYVDIAAGAARRDVQIFASRHDSREGVTAMDLTTLRQRLGAPATMTDEEVLSLATQRIEEMGTASGAPAGEADQAPPSGTTPPAPAPVPPVPSVPITTPVPTATAPGTGSDGATAPAPVPAAVPAEDTAPVVETIVEPVRQPAMASLPPGTVLIDEATLAEIRANAAAGARVAAETATARRGAFIDGVIAAGRMSPANVELRRHLEQTWDANPLAAQTVASNLAVAFPVAELGHGNSVEVPNDARAERSDFALFPELRPIRAGSNGQGRN